jgi:hypothetical protein
MVDGFVIHWTKKKAYPEYGGPFSALSIFEQRRTAGHTL